MKPNDDQPEYGPFSEHFAALNVFLTAKYKVDEVRAIRCLKDFLASVTARPGFTDEVLRNPRRTLQMLEEALCRFAASRLRPQNKGSEEESQDKFGFPKTIWTEVGRAGDKVDEIRLQALDGLLRKYLPALKAFLIVCFKRKFGVSFEWIEDCLQDFLYKKVLLKGLIQQADKEKGRFRDLLKTSLYNSAIDKLRKERPWLFTTPDGEGGAEGQSIAPPVDGENGGDVEWARRVLAEALRRMRKECRGKGQRIMWHVYERRRLRPLLRGEETESLDATVSFIEGKFQINISTKQISNWQKSAERKISRLRDDVLSEYCRDAAEIAYERQKLMEALLQAVRYGRRRRAD